MNPTETRPLPNAADKAALKVIASHVVKACPSLQDTAHEIATDLLIKYGVVGLDPDQVYFHRFKAAQSSSKSFTGWMHLYEKPYESLTLTQLVIHRFRATDQDNADLLDLYGGFYTDGPNSDNFNETNEVRLHGNEVLKDFWSINFSDVYRKKIQTFWDDFADEFRTLAKCSFLDKAVEARDNWHLSDDDFQTVVKAVIGPLTWPVSLKMLQSTTPTSEGARVCALDIAGHVATNILRIIDPKGRQILYVPGEEDAFQVLDTEMAMCWWAMYRMNDKELRDALLSHFTLADRQAITDNLTDLNKSLEASWRLTNYHMINQKDLKVTGDAFSWLRDSTRSAMFAEADLTLTSNGDLRKKLWIGYLSAGLRVFGPMAAVGWPVALPVIGASLANTGLNIDQAVNGKTASERKQGVIGAILSGIDTLLNLPFLKGVGSMAEVGAEVEAAEASEMAEVSQGTQPLEQPVSPEEQLTPPEETPAALPPIGEVMPPETVARPEIPQEYQCNELLEGETPVTEPGKFQGIYRLESDPPYAILLDDTAYYVRYFPDSRGGGFWAIVDPVRPNQFINSLPVRLNAEGAWERLPRLRLKGGGQCLGKECVVEVELQELGQDPAGAEGGAPANGQSQPSTSTGSRLVTTSYDVAPSARASLRKWAMGLPETHVRVQLGPGGAPFIADRYAPNFLDQARALQTSARRFYQNLPWANLPPRPEIPPVDSSTTIDALIEHVFNVAPGLVIGETLDRITSMRLMIENMPSFASQGVKTIYVRRLLSDFAQTDLNQYFDSGVMSEDLQTYLTRLGTDPTERFNELQLVKTARQNGIRIQATECAANYKKPSALLPTDEQMMTSYLTSDIMFSDKVLNPPGKWVVLTGVENTSTFRGLAGLSELEGGIGLRIEEVNPGEAHGIEADPGIEIDRGPFVANAVAPGTVHMQGTFDIFHADLRLQLEAPPVSRTAQQTDKLLYRKGMYVFEKTGEAYNLVHRSQSDEIIRTAVESTADGHYQIIRPSWPSVSGIPFPSIEQLSRGLNSMGLSLQSRIPA